MNKPTNITLILLVATIISGCIIYNPVADFTKKRYTNGVSYFNTFYNAQRLFEDGQNELVKAKKEFFDKGTSGKVFILPSSARQKFQSSIEKNSKVLSFYPTSKWVDDALLMIGKAYFYMEDDVRAERKFLELENQFPLSDLIPEAQLWLGKSLLRQKKYDAAIKKLEALIAQRSIIDDEIAGEAAFELGQYYFSEKKFDNAIKLFTVSVGLVSENELQTQIYFQIGKSYLALQEFDLAEKAFMSAEDYSPQYSLIFQSKLQQIKTHALQEKYDTALSELNDMLNDTKNVEFFSLVHFEIAYTLGMQGKTTESIEKYRYVDTAFARTDEAARSYFAVAKYYETVEINYDSTRVFYNKAKTEFPTSEINSEATLKADVFNKYLTLVTDISKFDSLYNNSIFVKAQMDSTPKISPDTIRMKKDTTTIVREDPKIKKMTKPGKADIKKDTIQSIDSTKFKDFIKREQLQIKLIDSLQRSIVRTKFEIAGLFYLEIQNPDSALFWFDNVIKNNPASEFTPRSLFTVAEIYRTVKQQPKAVLDSIYKIIIERYPNSPYANESRKNLGLPVYELQKDSALTMFDNAEKYAEDKKYEQAINLYKKIADQYSASSYSSKALYSAGWHYENSMMINDSAISVYRRLLLKYPASIYSGTVRPKVAEYDAEIKRIEDERLQKIEETKLKEQLEKEQKMQLEKTPIQTPSDSLSTPKK